MSTQDKNEAPDVGSGSEMVPAERKRYCHSCLKNQEYEQKLFCKICAVCRIVLRDDEER